ncbi:hypothetical protein JTE90_022603 [Oedothorax gibbosus]|uniref:Uncharacterized protein n=1 Tax=Oedothorax gibbosus TaxID=931172 RepID=A0AAV6TTH3_9ARAC|nr:hypothetical protein JTE90_022603 [Oedothorax gibbosus]
MANKNSCLAYLPIAMAIVTLARYQLLVPYHYLSRLGYKAQKGEIVPKGFQKRRNELFWKPLLKSCWAMCGVLSIRQPNRSRMDEDDLSLESRVGYCGDMCCNWRCTSVEIQKYSICRKTKPPE